MPQYVIIAYDAKDPGAYDRRLRIRESEVESINRMRASGNILMGVALTDDNGKMVGSVIITNFPSRTELDEWLAHEPYVVGKVWGDIKIYDSIIGPSFVDLIK